MKRVLITGGAGFIGSHFTELCVKEGYRPVVLDLLTYAGNRTNLRHLEGSYDLVVGNICDAKLVEQVLSDTQPVALFNFAAESHVDRSISGPKDFIDTNIYGTFVLLNEVLKYTRSKAGSDFRFVQISTDEVFGSLTDDGFFTEKSPYQPNSPYSACKASADHLARAWHHTYGLPVLVTHCSNNYGPRQYPEKLIPFMIQSALQDKPLGVYGNGKNIRDWIHVEDHCRGIFQAYKLGKAGQSFCFGGNAERTNLDLVRSLCDALDEVKPREDKQSHKAAITFVKDRLGHDWRYAIDDSLARTQLAFTQKHQNFEIALKDTVQWYVQNQAWRQDIMESNP